MSRDGDSFHLRTRGVRTLRRSKFGCAREKSFDRSGGIHRVPSIIADRLRAFVVMYGDRTRTTPGVGSSVSDCCVLLACFLLRVVWQRPS